MSNYQIAANAVYRLLRKLGIPRDGNTFRNAARGVFAPTKIDPKTEEVEVAEQPKPLADLFLELVQAALTDLHTHNLLIMHGIDCVSDDGYLFKIAYNAAQAEFFSNRLITIPATTYRRARQAKKTDPDVELPKIKSHQLDEVFSDEHYLHDGVEPYWRHAEQQLMSPISGGTASVNESELLEELNHLCPSPLEQRLLNAFLDGATRNEDGRVEPPTYAEVAAACETTVYRVRRFLDELAAQGRERGTFCVSRNRDGGGQPRVTSPTVADLFEKWSSNVN